MTKRWTSGWVGMSGRQRGLGGECRVIQPAVRPVWTEEDVLAALEELKADYDPVRDRLRYRQLNERLREIRRRS